MMNQETKQKQRERMREIGERMAATIAALNRQDRSDTESQPAKVFSDAELASFIRALTDVVIDYPITIGMIQRCLPIMGTLRDNGWNPDEILAAVMTFGGTKQGGH